jgi:hypothetical protein
MALPWEVKWPGQDQQSLQNNAPDFFGGIKGMWEDFMRADQERVDKTMNEYHSRPQYQENRARLAASQPQQSQAPRSQPSASMNLIRSLGGQNKTTMDSPVEDQVDPEDERMQAVIKAIQERLSHGYVDDGAYNGMIDEAFGGALSAIGNARTKAQGNYQESDKVLEHLTAGHVNAIKGEDMDAIKRIGAENQAGIKGIYDGAIAGESADRQKEIDARAEALSRYGLEESGMGTTGQAHSEAITDLNASSADGQNMARGMQAADESLNVARAESQAGEGVERRSSLRRDLDNILGDLDQSEASVQQQKGMARLQAKQADQQAFAQSQAADTDTLETYLRNKREDRLAATKASASTKGSATANDLIRQRFQAKGIDPTPFEQAYSEVMADNDYSSASGKDKGAHFVEKMSKKLKGKNVSISDIEDWVSFKQGYGTDKGNAKDLILN